jgi:hypothetical protein
MCDDKHKGQKSHKIWEEAASLPYRESATCDILNGELINR